MRVNFYSTSLILIFLLAACDQDNKNSLLPSGLEPNKVSNTTNKYNYPNLQHLITYGRANLKEVRQALTDTNPASLSNTINALYSMRWHRGVLHVLNGAWEIDQNKYPELAWEHLNKTPARIALASTINRIKITGTEEYLNYIRSYKYDKHEFNRAQVCIALGFNGAPEDIDYLKEMANSDNDYVIQSAITALGLMGGNQARDALVDLWKNNRESPKGDLVEDLLLKAYNVIPSTEKPKDKLPSSNSAG